MLRYLPFLTILLALSGPACAEETHVESEPAPPALCEETCGENEPMPPASGAEAGAPPAQTPPAPSVLPAQTPIVEPQSGLSASLPTRSVGKARSQLRPLSFYLINAYVFDSNIDRSKEDPIDSQEAVFGTGMSYRWPPKDPHLKLHYLVARHLHSMHAWDRIRHSFRADYEWRLTNRWRTELASGISLKGSSEDSSLSDEYLLSPQLKYRLDRRNRLGLHGTYRLRKYPDSPGSDARNHYYGLLWEYRFARKRQLEIGYRYETNDAVDPNSDYLRWTYGAEYSTPISEDDSLALDLRYRPRKYERRVEREDGSEAARFDRNWVITTSWRRALGRELDLSISHRYETRASNDPDKSFDEHTVATTVTRRW